MGIDRESAVRKAEELVREGKFDLAIDEYVRLVEDQPGDVGAANALGDLYAKVGSRALAVAQFAKIGDHHRDSGFVPKAVAFYKKALKVDPASDHALSQLAEIAVEQELYADATLYLNRLLQRRREQNNEAGVADCLVRLAGFPSATADAKIAAARASANHFSPERTGRLWLDAADALERASRLREAVDVLMQASSLDPENVALRRRVAVACAATGQIDRARAFLSFETAGDHPDLLLSLAERAIAEGRDDEARRALERVIAVAPDRRAEAEVMLAPLQADTAAAPTGHELPTDFFAMEVDASDGGEIDVAAAFGSGADDTSAETEALSFDLDTSGGGAAAVVAAPEAIEPEAEDPAPVAASEFEWSALLGDAPEEGAEEGVGDAGEDSAGTDDAVYIEPEGEPVAVEDDIAEPVVIEAPAPAPEPEPEPIAQADAPSASDLESIAALTAAAQNPALQFQASAQLGRLLLRLGRAADGIQWLERATQAVTSAREQRLDVMYELADALERAGDRARALDVFADLDFDAASFRDVPERMASLRRALGEGRAT